ncbi:VanZ family protein [Bosea sp. BE125]|uniref:VanZ family protein n=1 Tax=Bosea sp. BE125 TaxID=2817909 RepID=UPI00285E58AD|nr:VanZ family protein [Bosea sp. BE125]MDR6869797.1 VanZ family protein [Bosea sp. BE125]
MRVFKSAALVCGWIGLAYLVWVSIMPIGSRPHLFDEVPDISRLLGWFAITLAFAIAYPRSLGRVLLAMSVAIVMLEAVQYLEVTRHGRIHDAVVKVAGAAVAVVLTLGCLAVARKRAPVQEPS